MKKRILLTYAMYGNGHRAIAEYIESYFKSQDPELEILAIDILKYSTPILGSLSQKVTDFLLLKFPLGWTMMYKSFDNKLNSAIASKQSLGLFKNKRMKKIITDFNPDMTISTHFFGSVLIDRLNRTGITHTKLITVVTDYEAHALWLKGYKREQAIVVGDKDEVNYLVKKGVDREKIKPWGIPINPITSDDFEVEKAIKHYGFKGNRPICLFFGGGGNGGTHSLPYIRYIIKSNLNIDFIYVAGKNEAAKNKVDKWIKQYKCKNIKTFGFVTNVPELLQICDFVVTKPGGAQTTESLYFKRPVIMINSSGGQEIANYKYFVKNGYGRRFRTPFTFNRYMREISENPSIIAQMQNNMANNDNNHAMEKLYKLATNILKEDD